MNRARQSSPTAKAAERGGLAPCALALALALGCGGCDARAGRPHSIPGRVELPTAAPGRASKPETAVPAAPKAHASDCPAAAPWKLRLVGQEEAKTLRATEGSAPLTRATLPPALAQLGKRAAGASGYALDTRTFLLVDRGQSELWDLADARRVARARSDGELSSKVFRIDAQRVLVEGAIKPYQHTASQLWLRDCDARQQGSWQQPYYLDRSVTAPATQLTDGSLLSLSGFWLAADGRRFELFDPPPAFSSGFNVPEGALLVALGERSALRVGGVLTNTLEPEGLPPRELARRLMAPVVRIELPQFAEHAAPQLKHPRFGHSATALPGGSALIAGGASYLGVAPELERWDPRAQRFVGAGRLRHARVGHSATILQDGSVLLVGGCSLDMEGSSTPSLRVAASGAAQSAELWRPGQAKTADAGRMQQARCGHAAVRLADSRVLVIGGYEHPLGIVSAGRVAAGDGYLRSCEIFDPATGRWSAGPDMQRGRADAFALLLPDGRVLVVGSEDRRSTVPPSVEVLSADQRAWQTSSTLGLDAGEMRLHLAPDGRVLMLSYGDVLEAFQR